MHARRPPCLCLSIRVRLQPDVRNTQFARNVARASHPSLTASSRAGAQSDAATIAAACSRLSCVLCGDNRRARFLDDCVTVCRLVPRASFFVSIAICASNACEGLAAESGDTGCSLLDCVRHDDAPWHLAGMCACDGCAAQSYLSLRACDPDSRHLPCEQTSKPLFLPCAHFASNLCCEFAVVRNAKSTTVTSSAAHSRGSRRGRIEVCHEERHRLLSDRLGELPAGKQTVVRWVCTSCDACSCSAYACALLLDSPDGVALAGH